MAAAKNHMMNDFTPEKQSKAACTDKKESLVTTSSMYSNLDYVQYVAKYRPKYSDELVDNIRSYLARKLTPPWDLAVDMGCGSGNGTRMLCGYFDRVVGCDKSDTQLEVARINSEGFSVQYIQCTEEALPFDDHSVDVVVCGLSIHFLDLDPFYEELERILKPGGCLAAYGLTELELEKDGKKFQLREVTSSMEEIYKLNGSSFKNLKSVFEKYSDIPWPYDEVERFDCNGFDRVDLDWLENYLSTRLAHQTLICKAGKDAGEKLMDDMRRKVSAALNLLDSKDEFIIIVPMFLVMCRKPI